MAGGLELPAPEVRASIFLQTARKHSLKMLKQLGSDDPWSPCTGQSGLTEGGGGPDVRPGSRLAGPQERPLAVPTPPFPPSLATPGPPASLAQSGLPAPYRERQPPETAARSHAPSHRVREISCSKSSPATAPPPHAISNNLELRAHSLRIFGSGERETEKLIPTGGLKLPPKVKNLKTWRFYKELLVLQASKREGSPGPKSSPARTSSPSAVGNTGTAPAPGVCPQGSKDARPRITTSRF